MASAACTRDRRLDIVDTLCGELRRLKIAPVNAEQARMAGRVISHSRRLSMRMGAHGQFARDVLCGYERDLAVAMA